MQDQQKVWDEIAPHWDKVRRGTSKSLQPLLEKQQKIWPAGKIIDIGCGNGRHLTGFAHAGFECYGMDASTEMIKFARKFCRKQEMKVIFKQGKMDKLPWPKETFDYALSLAVLHHAQSAEERKHAIEEMYRVLKSKGQGIISVWNKWQKGFMWSKKEQCIGWKLPQGEPQRYYYFFTPFELKKLLKKTGFHVQRKSKLWDRNNIYLIEKP
ncbi:MAG: class I SAM-dependent methyltransferase [Nanoarchaeota archaeon]